MLLYGMILKKQKREYPFHPFGFIDRSSDEELELEEDVEEELSELSVGLFIDKFKVLTRSSSLSS